ncbi:tyrosine-type recombinase/integrase [Acutalibacter muris]|uniref:tyrosine-type recombinase/integrase n=1 Tax=Acutalibacter muris TaxID=1796620 RepID=UPI001C3F0B35|nr:site-specific integrase [Acutalibacter muris]
MAKKRANGEGNIRKRKDGRWEGRYTAGYDPATGKRLIKNVLGETQAEVKEKLAVAMDDAKDLDIARSDDYTVGSWLTNWYTLYAKPNVRVSTAEYYRRNIELHVTPRIGDIKLNKLTGRDLQKLYQDLRENGRLREAQKEKFPGLSASTVRGIHLMLHNAMDRAVKERLIQRNPTEDCIAPKLEKKEMKFLPVEDMKAYLDEADRRHVLPMFYLELVSGLRKGELVALLWSDLDIENQTISVSKQATRDENGNIVITRPKTETSVRLVSIPQKAVELLQREHLKHPDNPYMFPSTRTGEMYYPDSIVTLHKRILKSAELSYIPFHSLRHTFATAALQNGVDVKTVSSMLGHYDAGFTLRTYTHATRQKQEQAAEKMGNFMDKVM